MTTSDDAHSLSLADLDHILAPEYEVLLPGELRNDILHALGALRNKAAAQTHYFYSAQEYVTFATSVAPRRWLAEEGGTRYIELSAQYDADPWSQGASPAWTTASRLMERQTPLAIHFLTSLTISHSACQLGTDASIATFPTF